MNKPEHRGIKNSKIKDYRITWRYCTSIKTSNHIKNLLPEFFKEKICIMALDSDMNFYKYENDNFIIKHFQLICDHGYPSGTIKFDEELNFDGQEEHYLYEVAGMLIHRNLMFDDLDVTKTMYMMLQPIYIVYGGKYLGLYPMIKLRNKMIMIEYRVFPGDNEIDIDTFVDEYADILHKKIEKIEMDTNLFKALFPNERICFEKEIEHDGCKQKICTVPEGIYEYLKDVSLSIFYLITKNEEINWIGRTTYSVSADISEKQITKLLFSVVGDIKRIPQGVLKNYREFNDYKHYVTAGTTLTVGDILSTYMFADALDEEILFYMTKIGHLRSEVERCDIENDNELINLYESVLQLKHKYLSKYNHLACVRDIMSDLWIELKSDEIIEQIKAIIELNLKKVEMKKNRKMNNIQLYYSIVAVLLSSAPLYEFIIIPIYCQAYGVEYSDIGNYCRIGLFIATFALFFLILIITKFLFIKIKN